MDPQNISIGEPDVNLDVSPGQTISFGVPVTNYHTQTDVGSPYACGGLVSPGYTVQVSAYINETFVGSTSGCVENGNTSDFSLSGEVPESEGTYSLRIEAQTLDGVYEFDTLTTFIFVDEEHSGGSGNQNGGSDNPLENRDEVGVLIMFVAAVFVSFRYLKE
jgi:hypothetical protein